MGKHAAVSDIGMPRSSAKAGTHWYVQPTIRDGKRIVAGTPVEGRSAPHALLLMDTFKARKVVGAAAFEVEIGEDGEPVEEPAIIGRFGRVPGMEDERSEDVGE